MRMMRVLFTVAVAAGFLTSCSTIGGWFGGGKDAPAVEQGDSAVNAANQEEAEARLREMVSGYVNSELRAGTKDQPELVHKRPYFYRQFVEYPGGADQFEVTLQENESRTRPMAAEVRLDKVRFSTQMHRKRDLALEDTAFLRDTGTETLHYELRNGRWHRSGSLFVADKTEEYLEGEWVPRREQTVRVNPDENRPGWFSRTMSKIFGSDTE